MESKSQNIVPWRLSVAPMMDWTDRHCRAFHRVLSRHALLYTEMVTSAALVRGGAVRLLDFDAAEHPVALQLGGSEPEELAQATRLGCEHGYAEINLNVGCPSDRVQSGCFGAILMERPDLVADCLAAMIEAAGEVPVTMKCRIGVDEQDPAIVLPDILTRVRDVGVTRVTIHARKAWLQGLSPKENREIPPLDYPLVHAMKDRFPDMHLSINGGITDLGQVEGQLAIMDGVMVGRAAYHDPATILMDADRRIFGAENPVAGRVEAALAMVPYLERHLDAGGKLGQVTRHMLGLFAGQPGARAWRRVLSEQGPREGAGLAAFHEALGHVTDSAA